MNSIPQNQIDKQPTFLPSQSQILPMQPQDISLQTVPQNIPQMRGISHQTQPHQMDNLDPKRHRRSKHEQEGRIYHCECGKAYLSQPALNNHKKSKHPELNSNGEKRGRGRPRKYLPNLAGEFETHRYENFFSSINRKKDEPINIQRVIKKVYQFLFRGEYKDKLYSRPEKLEDNILLHNLKNSASLESTKEKKDRVCDEVLYEYLVLAKDQTNENYFELIVNFILLFRECFNLSKNPNNLESLENRKEASVDTLPESLPELCNEFYTNFMEQNSFFGLEGEQNEIIEIIQHFCIWLFKNDYTKSKLSLAQ